MPGGVGQEILWALDPVLWAREELGITLQPWQETVVTSTAKRQILNLHRQAGKTFAVTCRGLHEFVFKRGSHVCIVSPSFKQSQHISRRFKRWYDKLSYKPGLVEDNRFYQHSDNDSTLTVLSGDSDTNRGVSDITLLLGDENSRCNDELMASVMPALAKSNGSCIILSTPAGVQGFFYRQWCSEGWQKTKLTGADDPQVDPKFLDQQRDELGDFLFNQEWNCVFQDLEQCAFAGLNYDNIFDKGISAICLKD